MDLEERLVLKFAERIKIITRDRFIKMEDFENQVGVSTGYFSRISSDEQKRITLYTAFKVCSILKMRVDEILNYKNKSELIAEKLNQTVLNDLLKEFSKEDLIDYIRDKDVEE